LTIRPVVIAHRGASGYLPEHTLAAKALAFGMGADYLEQDVVATRDGHLIVFHDLTLDQTTDVRERYPGRAREDGRFYCIDFTLDEIRGLNAGERRAAGKDEARFPGRFPVGVSRFGVCTLEEELEFVAGLARSTQRRIGIYPEIKEPAWHRSEGIDLGARLLATLEQFGYRSASDHVFVQCFDPAELKRLRFDLGCKLQLVQLLDSADPVPSASDLRKIARYAVAIGPALGLICRGPGPSGLALSGLVGEARDAGLAIHPYTFRKDDLPAGFASFRALLDLFIDQIGVDGLFTDFPDLVVEHLAARLPK
jgi:glycerophosphoryl diester phosphodiesterase